MPVWCRPGCKHLRTPPQHRRPHLLACTWRLSPCKWALGRIDRMTGCPFTENAQNRVAGGAAGKGRLPLAPEGKRPLAGGGSFWGTVGLRVLWRSKESRGKFFRKTGKTHNFLSQFSDTLTGREALLLLALRRIGDAT